MSVKSALLEMHILRKQTSKRTETAAFTKYHGRNLHIRANFDYISELSAAPLASEQEAPGSTQEKAARSGTDCTYKNSSAQGAHKLTVMGAKIPARLQGQTSTARRCAKSCRGSPVAHPARPAAAALGSTPVGVEFRASTLRFDSTKGSTNAWIRSSRVTSGSAAVDVAPPEPAVDDRDAISARPFGSNF